MNLLFMPYYVCFRYGCFAVLTLYLLHGRFFKTHSFMFFLCEMIDLAFSSSSLQSWHITFGSVRARLDRYEGRLLGRVN